ncbi:MAG: hypothetical protein U5K84_10280 [Alkalibacterium sp.]|nr:hypothetical protein [Alkalibacterium sp.]
MDATFRVIHFRDGTRYFSVFAFALVVMLHFRDEGIKFFRRHLVLFSRFVPPLHFLSVSPGYLKTIGTNLILRKVSIVA